MATLQEMLTPEVEPHFVADCQALIDGEVNSKSGISGTADQGRLQGRGDVRAGLLHRDDQEHPAGHAGRA